MLRFMLQDGVAEILISFITLVSAEGERPVRGGADSEAIKKSYRCGRPFPPAHRCPQGVASAPADLSPPALR